VQKDSSYVFDTSAIFCLKENSSGAGKVEEILEDAKRHKVRVLVSFMTLMEYLYINLMRADETAAHYSYLQLTLLPIIVVESDEDLRIAAAKLKAQNNISAADAWIAATALTTDSVLVHRDPEFDSLKEIIKCLALPYKKKKGK
jgi:predicted nucleic acid-binding protein